MIALLWDVSINVRRYLCTYMPTNIAIDQLRRSRDFKWATSAAVLATGAYLVAMSLCTTLVAGGGPGLLNVLVLLFFWNAMKFAWLTALSLLQIARSLAEGHIRRIVGIRRSDPTSGIARCDPTRLVAIPVPAHSRSKNSMSPTNMAMDRTKASSSTV